MSGELCYKYWTLISSKIILTHANNLLLIPESKMMIERVMPGWTIHGSCAALEAVHRSPNGLNKLSRHTPHTPFEFEREFVGAFLHMSHKMKFWDEEPNHFLKCCSIEREQSHFAMADTHIEFDRVLACNVVGDEYAVDSINQATTKCIAHSNVNKTKSVAYIALILAQRQCQGSSTHPSPLTKSTTLVGHMRTCRHDTNTAPVTERTRPLLYPATLPALVTVLQAMVYQGYQPMGQHRSGQFRIDAPIS